MKDTNLYKVRPAGLLHSTANAELLLQLQLDMCFFTLWLHPAWASERPASLCIQLELNMHCCTYQHLLLRHQPLQDEASVGHHNHI
jgi:hypothetical protein